MSRLRGGGWKNDPDAKRQGGQLSANFKLFFVFVFSLLSVRLGAHHLSNVRLF